MAKPFEEALDDLVQLYDNTPIDELISVLQAQIEALKDELGDEDEEGEEETKG